MGLGKERGSVKKQTADLMCVCGFSEGLPGQLFTVIAIWLSSDNLKEPSRYALSSPHISQSNIEQNWQVKNNESVGEYGASAKVQNNAAFTEGLSLVQHQNRAACKSVTLVPGDLVPFSGHGRHL